MIGETALSTRTKCDECKHRTATRQTGASVFCETCEPDAPRAANDDAQGAFCARPLCTRCNVRPAFLCIKAGLMPCSECLSEPDMRALADVISVASTPQDAKVTAAVPSALPQVAVAVTSPSKEPDALALLFCAPLRRSSNITKGDRPGTEISAPRQNTLEPTEGLKFSGDQPAGVCSSERDGFGATNSSSCGSAQSGRGCKLGATGPESSDLDGDNRAGGSSERGRYAQAGVTTGPQDSTPALPQGGSPVTVGGDARALAPAVTPIFDLETDALVTGLEAGWALERRNSSTLRVVAASEMAPKSGSENPNRST